MHHIEGYRIENSLKPLHEDPPGKGSDKAEASLPQRRKKTLDQLEPSWFKAPSQDLDPAKSNPTDPPPWPARTTTKRRKSQGTLFPVGEDAFAGTPLLKGLHTGEVVDVETPTASHSSYPRRNPNPSTPDT